MSHKLGYGCLVKAGGSYQGMIGVYLGSKIEPKRVHFVRLSHGSVCIPDNHVNFYQRALVMDDKVEFFSHGSMVRGVVVDVDYDSFQAKIKTETEQTEIVPLTTIRLQTQTPEKTMSPFIAESGLEEKIDMLIATYGRETTAQTMLLILGRQHKTSPTWNFSIPCDKFDTDEYVSHVTMPLKRFCELYSYGILDKEKSYHLSDGTHYDETTDAARDVFRNATHVFIKTNQLRKSAIKENFK